MSDSAFLTDSIALVREQLWELETCGRTIDSTDIKTMEQVGELREPRRPMAEKLHALVEAEVEARRHKAASLSGGIMALRGVFVVTPAASVEVCKVDAFNGFSSAFVGSSVMEGNQNVGADCDTFRCRDRIHVLTRMVGKTCWVELSYRWQLEPKFDAVVSVPPILRSNCICVSIVVKNAICPGIVVTGASVSCITEKFFDALEGRSHPRFAASAATDNRILQLAHKDASVGRVGTGALSKIGIRICGLASQHDYANLAKRHHRVIETPSHPVGSKVMVVNKSHGNKSNPMDYEGPYLTSDMSEGSLCGLTDLNGELLSYKVPTKKIVYNAAANVTLTSKGDFVQGCQKVLKVINHRRSPCHYECLVQWKGFDEPTWEPVSHFNLLCIEECWE